MEESVQYSPCAGPDLERLNSLEQVDRATVWMLHGDDDNDNDNDISDAARMRLLERYEDWVEECGGGGSWDESSAADANGDGEERRWMVSRKD